MKKSISVQTSFSEGMIDGIKQDVPFNANPTGITSVLWLENYNNTLQQDTAIKRWGEVDSGLDYLDLGYFCPNEPYTYIVNADTNTEADKSSWLQGTQIYDVVRPEYLTNYTCFLRRYPNIDTGYSDDYIPQHIKDDAGTTGFQNCEAVAVVSHTRSTKGAVKQWQEVWADGVTTYPGWYTFGSLADVTRYGETLIFTTTLELQEYYVFDSGLGTMVPNAVNGYLFPVYRYLYWDIRKKQEAGNQFLRGLADYADLSSTDYAKWKVLPPAQSLANTLRVGLVEGVQEGIAHVNVDGSNDWYHINISVEECSYVAFTTEDGGITTEAVNEKTISARYSPRWIKNEYIQISQKYYVALVNYVMYKFLVPSNSIFSLEELELPSFNNELLGIVNANTLRYANYSEVLGNCAVGETIAKRKPSIPATFAGMPRGSLNLTYGLASNYTDRIFCIAPSAEKYTESQAPRLWLYNEEIELVLTMNINGIDVLLHRETYTVKTKPYVPPPSFPNEYEYPTFITPYIQNGNAKASYPVIEPDITVHNFGNGQQNSLFICGTYLVNVQRTDNATPYSYNFFYESLLYFTIEVQEATMQKLIDANCSSLSLWAIKPDTERHIFKSVGITADSPSGNIYNKPQIQSNEVVDYTKYALLKKFVIDGQTEPPTSHSNWNRNPLATNAWYKRTDPGTGSQPADTFYTAIPLKSKEDGGDVMPSLPYFPNQGYVQQYLDGTNPTIFDTSWWTPDFVIWDYPTETTLFLNSSGKYWKGLGARLITVIKGRTFIGGCIGADGIEEQAIIRYSDVQGGAISPDIFSDERKIQVGHKPHTALLEFREQLWAFSRYQFYRIQMPAITEESTWEFNDVVEQGTFNNKSFVVVPYGVCFCNESGVWISEGGEPQNIGIAVLPTYQSISSGTAYVYTNLNVLPGIPYINEQGINPYLELCYDALADELIVYTPLFTLESVPLNGAYENDYKAVSDFSLIFSFKKKSWRVESSLVPDYTVQIQGGGS